MASPAPSRSRTPPASLGAVLSSAVAVVLGNLGTFLPVFAAWAALTASVDHTLYGVFGPPPGEQPDQSTLLPVLLSLEGAGLLLEILVGPLFAAIGIHAGRQWLAGRKAGLYASVNFALNRYGRMFVAHAAANTLIRLGLLIIVPGVLYIMQYAFVDSVAALESQKTWAMGRSKKLTRSRRKRIFFVFLPVLVLSQVAAIGDIWAYGQPGWILWALHLVQHGLFMVMAVAFFLMYAERTTPAAGDGEAAAG